MVPRYSGGVVSNHGQSQSGNWPAARTSAGRGQRAAVVEGVRSTKRY